MRQKLSEQYVKELCEKILRPIANEEHIQAWLVGGCVRDIIHGEGINDVDVLCTDASRMVSALDKHFNETNDDHSIHSMENGHATVISVLSKHIFGGFPILPARFDIEVSQLGHLDGFTLDELGGFTLETLDGLTLEEILERDARDRDFVCNAWYMDINNNSEPFTPLHTESTIYDPAGKYIYPCNGGKSIFNNPLRIFRAMDLMCRGYKPTNQLYYGIAGYIQNDLHPDIHRDAYLQVIHKIFSRLASEEYNVNNVIFAFNYFAELGVWGKMIHPVFPGMMSCIHKNRYHKDSVWQHTMNVIYNMARCKVLEEHGRQIKPTAYDYWAALLHDTGKTTTISHDWDGNTHFYDHQYESVRISTEILKDSPLNKVWTEYVLKLIAHHMDTKPFGDEPIKYHQYKHIRKLQWELGGMAFEHFLLLNYADCAASGRTENKNTINVVRAVKDMTYSRGESAWGCYKIPVDGNDIKEAFPDEPGVNIGKYIRQLYKVTFSRPEDYITKEQCLHYVGTLIKTGWAKKTHEEEPSTHDLKKQGKL